MTKNLNVLSLFVAALSSVPAYVHAQAVNDRSKTTASSQDTIENSVPVIDAKDHQTVIENSQSSQTKAEAKRSAKAAKKQREELTRIAEESPYLWIPKNRLPAELQKTVQPECTGMYLYDIPGMQTKAPSKEKLDQLPLTVTAKDATVEDGNTAKLEGEVLVTHGDRAISADKMSYDRQNDKAVLQDRVVISQQGMRIQGEYAEVSTIENRANFDDAHFVLQSKHLRGSAASVRQTSSSKIELHEGRLTSCEPGNEAWMLEGELLTVNSETNQGTGKNVKLRVGNVPVFYLPYITFPVGDERQSGFLFPSISSSDDGGLDIAIPYYWNIAPNYDATITPRFISGRGTMLETEGRYLNRWMRAEAGLAFLPDDGGSEDEDLRELVESGEISEDEAEPYKGNNRWLAQLKQRGGDITGLYTVADFTRVSDTDYLRDLGTSALSVSSTTYLNQSFEIGYQFDNWRISTLAQSQQVLLLDIVEPYRKMPQVDLDGSYRFDKWKVSLNNRFTHFTHPSDTPETLTGKRMNTDYRLQWEERAPWGFFKPEVGYKSIYYMLDENSLSNLKDEEFGYGAAQASLDFGLVFEHPAGIFTQTFEPRMMYLYREYTNQTKSFGLGEGRDQDINFDTSARTFTYGQLYRDTRFIGGDRLDDANQVTLGFTSNWQSNHSGRDLVTVSAGQIFHFDDRRVSLNNDSSDGADSTTTSEFASELLVHINDRTQLYGSAVYDTNSNKVNRGSAGINFASSDYRSLFNITYSYLRDDSNFRPRNDDRQMIDQVDTSFAIPITPQWALMGKFNYEFSDHQELETFLGFEYNDCCYRVRLMARRWLDSNIADLSRDKEARYDQGVFFEILFKGLGGSGTKTTSILNEGIFGFREREEYLSKKH